MSSNDNKGCSRAIAGACLVFTLSSCFMAYVVPPATGAVGNVIGFLSGLVVWGGLMALVGLAAALAAAAVQHAACWVLRKARQPLPPGRQVGWASVPAMLAAIVVAAATVNSIDHRRGEQIAAAAAAPVAQLRGQSLSAIMNRGMENGGQGGARIGFWGGVMLGGGLFLWVTLRAVGETHGHAEQAYFARSQAVGAAASPNTAGTASIGSANPGLGAGGSSQWNSGSVSPPSSPAPTQAPPPSQSASTQTQATPPPSSPGKASTSVNPVRAMVDAAALELEKIDKQISQVAMDLMNGDIWPKLADEFRRAADINALARHTPQATQDLIDQYQALADEDLRELNQALQRDEDAASLLGEVKQKLERMNAPSTEIDEIESIYDEVGVLHLDLLPSRQWDDHRDGLEALPEAIAELGCYQRAAKDLGFNDVADVTAETLKKAFRRFSILTHPDLNKGMGTQDHFTRVQYAKELLTDYLATLGKTA